MGKVSICKGGYMPGPKPKRKKPVKIFHDVYETPGQRVSDDGSTVIMPNGHQYKRTVLPPAAGLVPPSATDGSEQMLVEIAQEDQEDQEAQ